MSAPDLAALEQAVHKTTKLLAELRRKNARLAEQLAAAKKAKSDDGESVAPSAEALPAEIRTRLEALEQDLRALLPS